MHLIQRADCGKILDNNMASEGGSIGKNTRVAYSTVVTNMSIGHNETVTADSRDPAPTHRTARNGDTFTDGILVT